MGDVGGGLLALEDLAGRPVDDLLGPLEAALVALAGLGAQDGLAAALGLLGDASVVVQAQDGGAGVDGLGRRPDVLERLVCVDAGRCGSAGGAGVDGGRCECVSDLEKFQRLSGTRSSVCLRNCIPLPFVFAILSCCSEMLCMGRQRSGNFGIDKNLKCYRHNVSYPASPG